MEAIEAVRAELAALQAEHDQWEAAYDKAAAAMTEALKPYNNHHSKIERLSRALRVLEGK